MRELDPADERRALPRDPAEDEERRPRPVSLQQGEQTVDTGRDPALEPAPIGECDIGLKRRDLEVLFDVDGEVVLDTRWSPAFARRLPARDAGRRWGEVSRTDRARIGVQVVTSRRASGATVPAGTGLAAAPKASTSWRTHRSIRE